MQQYLVLVLLLFLTAQVSSQSGEGAAANAEGDTSQPVESIYICECSDEKFLGKYNIVSLLL